MEDIRKAKQSGRNTVDEAIRNMYKMSKNVQNTKKSSLVNDRRWVSSVYHANYKNRNTLILKGSKII